MTVAFALVERVGRSAAGVPEKLTKMAADTVLECLLDRGRTRGYNAAS